MQSLKPTDDKQWRIDLVQDRYSWLKLSPEQAELVYNYEQEKNAFSFEHSFSPWEEWDYESDFFKEILSEKQLKVFQSRLKSSIKRFEANLIVGDKSELNEIDYYQELLDYYQNKFVHAFSEKPFKILSSALIYEQSKIEFLKAEYKKYLNDFKKQILTEHYRHNKTFAPNKLKYALLEHKIACVWPNYFRFKYAMDEPTKAVGEYLEERLKNTSEDITELVVTNFKKLETTRKRLEKKYRGDQKGWTHTIHLSIENENVFPLMEYLILDTNYYGY